MPESDRPQVRPPSYRLTIAILLGAIWLSILLWMTLTTANPTTLNRFQVQNSDLIVQGQFDDGLKKFTIEKSWPEDAEQDSIRFHNVMELSASPGIKYLVPVVKIENVYYATPTKVRGKPLIYPVTEDATQQLKSLLNEPKD